MRDSQRGTIQDPRINIPLTPTEQAAFDAQDPLATLVDAVCLYLAGDRTEHDRDTLESAADAAQQIVDNSRSFTARNGKG